MLRARHTAARALILRSGRSPYLEGRGRLLHPSRRALVRAPQSLQRNADLILRSLRSKRLEGWTQRADLWPSFETRARRAPQDEVGDMFAAVGWAKRSVPTIQDRDRISGGHGARGAFAHPCISNSLTRSQYKGFGMLRIGGATAPSGCAPHAMTAKPLGGNEAGDRFTAD